MKKILQMIFDWFYRKQKKKNPTPIPTPTPVTGPLIDPPYTAEYMAANCDFEECGLERHTAKLVVYLQRSNRPYIRRNIRESYFRGLRQGRLLIYPSWLLFAGTAITRPKPSRKFNPQQIHIC